jgi:hypothetical protein
LEKVCSKYGKVIKCFIKNTTNPDGSTRKLSQAQVSYADKETAEKAYQKLYMDNDLNPNAALEIQFYQNRLSRMVEKDN